MANRKKKKQPNIFNDINLDVNGIKLLCSAIVKSAVKEKDSDFFFTDLFAICEEFVPFYKAHFDELVEMTDRD